MGSRAHQKQRFATGAFALFAVVCLLSTSASAASDPCYGLTYEGYCDGDIAQWCENGEVIQIDCSDQGMVCTWNDEKNYYGCAESESCYLPETGSCLSPTTVAWCHDNGDTEELECGEGTICGWNKEESYFDCIPEEEFGGVLPTRQESTEEEEPEAEGIDEDHYSSNHQEDPVVEAETVSGGTADWFEFSDENTQKTDSNEPYTDVSPSEEPVSTGCQTTKRPVIAGFIWLLGVLLFVRHRQRFIQS